MATATEALIAPDFHAPLVAGDRPLEVTELTTATVDEIIASARLWAGMDLYGQYALGKHFAEIRDRIKGEGWTSWLRNNCTRIGRPVSQVYKWLNVYEALESVAFFEGLDSRQSLEKAGKVNLQNGAIDVLASPSTPNQARLEILEIASSGAIVRKDEAAAIANMAANPEPRLIDAPKFTMQQLRDLVAPHWTVSADVDDAVRLRCAIPGREGAERVCPTALFAKGWWEQVGRAQTEKVLLWNQYPIGSRVIVAGGSLGQIMSYEDELMAQVLLSDQGETFPIPFADLQPAPRNGVLKDAQRFLDEGDIIGAAKAMRAAAQVVQHGHPAGIADKSGNDEQYTPERLWRPALEVFGGEVFDLDPASHIGSNIPATRIFTIDDNALTQDWGCVDLWFNFPFSKQKEFAAKFLEEWKTGKIGSAIGLSKQDNRTEWWSDMAAACTAFCLVEGYDKFTSPEHTNTGNSFFPIVIWYFGSEIDKFFYAYSGVGTVVQAINPEMFGG